MKLSSKQISKDCTSLHIGVLHVAVSLQSWRKYTKRLTKRRNSLRGISGIPTLIIVDKDGNVLLEDGYMDIAQATDPAKVVKGWKELK